jgi:long-chain acyl-CoA synthetase
MTGCSATLVPALHAGERLVLMRKFEPEAALRLIEHERLTSAGGVPAIAWQLAGEAQRDRYDLSSLGAIGFGGSPAGEALMQRLLEVFPQALPSTGWGMTETTATFASQLGEEYIAHPTSCGIALPVNDLRIVAANGEELGAGAIGELQVRGPTVVRGYWDDPVATRTAFDDGWLRTGDLARVDAEGYLYIEGRLKDMIIRGGENIACPEVEEAFLRVPGVRDVAVIGLPHPALGEVPAAVVAVADPASFEAAAARATVTRSLAAFKVPERIVATAGDLPRNAGGKLMKHEIRARFFADVPGACV